MSDLREEQPTRLGVLIALTVANCLGAFGQIAMAILSGIVGTTMAPSPQLATLPVTAGILGVALGSVPLAYARRNFGSRMVFAAAMVWAAFGTGLAAWSINVGSFTGFCAGCFMIGNNMGSVAQFRFAATDLVPSRYVGRAISTVMLGVLVAAVVAPWFGLKFRYLFDVEFAGSYASLILAFIAGAVLVSMLPLKGPHTDGHLSNNDPSVLDALRRRPVQLAIAASAGGYGVMSLIMTATPISMHVMDEHSAEVTANVIRSHIFGMFAPSLISGWLVEKIGVGRMIWLGICMQAVCIAVAMNGQEVMHYQAALVLLGVGWNFLFTSGTALLALECNRGAGVRVQGINDFVMFSTMVLASLSAGGLLYNIGWAYTNLAATSLLVIILVAIFRASPIQSYAENKA